MQKMMKNVNIEIDFQNASQFQDIPDFSQFKQWVLSVLKEKCEEVEIVIRIVDEPEMKQLNLTYRNKNKPTNVLSFPLESSPLVGDVVICAPVVSEEAHSQNKEIKAHWAHLTIHGVLHLLGYDHVHSDEAEIMERLETQILEKLGFPNPYETPAD